jgi:hypothetical protein
LKKFITLDKREGVVITIEVTELLVKPLFIALDIIVGGVFNGIKFFKNEASSVG